MTDPMLQYQDDVIKYLEYLEYPDLVLEFHPDQVSLSIAKTIMVSYMCRTVSSRLCAILIFSGTMNFQIIPHANEAVKH